MRAGDLADSVGMERLAFKTDVRKLKALGLTESLEHRATACRRVARRGSTGDAAGSATTAATGRAVARHLGVPSRDLLDLSASLNPFAPDVAAVVGRPRRRRSAATRTPAAATAALADGDRVSAATASC